MPSSRQPISHDEWIAWAEELVASVAAEHESAFHDAVNKSGVDCNLGLSAVSIVLQQLATARDRLAINSGIPSPQALTPGVPSAPEPSVRQQSSPTIPKDLKS